MYIITSPLDVVLKVLVRCLFKDKCVSVFITSKAGVRSWKIGFVNKVNHTGIVTLTVNPQSLSSRNFRLRFVLLLFFSFFNVSELAFVIGLCQTSIGKGRLKKSGSYTRFRNSDYIQKTVWGIFRIIHYFRIRTFLILQCR